MKRLFSWLHFKTTVFYQRHRWADFPLYHGFRHFCYDRSSYRDFCEKYK